MGEIVVVANQKGGVAKTTSTYNLATLKAIEGKKVLMIDLESIFDNIMRFHARKNWFSCL